VSVESGHIKHSPVTRNKGGRPVKAVKRNYMVGVKCSYLEKVAIQSKAKEQGLTASEYLRELGIHCKIVRRHKSLPKEVLSLRASLHHIGANLNQIAKKRNSFDELTALERAELFTISKSIKQLTGQMTQFFQS
jgi:Mobilization protein NikA